METQRHKAENVRTPVSGVRMKSVGIVPGRLKTVFVCFNAIVDAIGHFTGQTTLHKCIAHSRAGQSLEFTIVYKLQMCQSFAFSVSNTELHQRKQHTLRADQVKFAIGKTLDTSQRLSSTMFLPHLANSS